MQHGTPLEVCDLGETEIDEATFNEYIDELRDQYTAEKVRAAAAFRKGSSQYSLVSSFRFAVTMSGVASALTLYSLDFNCNSFSNDVAGFLTGRSIPAHITGGLDCSVFKARREEVQFCLLATLQTSLRMCCPHPSVNHYGR